MSMSIFIKKFESSFFMSDFHLTKLAFHSDIDFLNINLLF